jgi:hypothetical protein
VPVPFVKDASRFAFYGPATRAWEFAVGVLLAIGAGRLSRIDRRVAVVMGIIGLTAVGWSAKTFSAMTLFPGIAALAPVGGAALLLVAGGASVSFGKVLGWRPLAWVGDISYGWYLWSWPAAVLTRAVWPVGQTAVIVAVAGSLVPAWLSYRFLGQPIRRNRRIAGWRAVGFAGICIATPIAFAVAIIVGAGMGWGLSMPHDVALLPLATRIGCDSVTPWPANQCTFRAPHPRGTILLLGDSHAQVISDAVTRAANAAGFDLAVWTRSGCSYLGRANQRDGCADWQKSATALAVAMKPARILIANYSTERSTYVGPGSMLDAAQQPVSTPAQAFAAWRDGLYSALQQLKAAQSTVILVHTVPEFETGGYQDISWIRPHGSHNTISLEQLESRRHETVAVEQAVAREFGFVELFDPAMFLCRDVCSTFLDGVWLYFDYSHLSLAGAAVLEKPLTRLFTEKSALTY